MRTTFQPLDRDKLAYEVWGITDGSKQLVFISSYHFSTVQWRAAIDKGSGNRQATPLLGSTDLYGCHQFWLNLCQLFHSCSVPCRNMMSQSKSTYFVTSTTAECWLSKDSMILWNAFFTMESASGQTSSQGWWQCSRRFGRWSGSKTHTVSSPALSFSSMMAKKFLWPPILKNHHMTTFWKTLVYTQTVEKESTHPLH